MDYNKGDITWDEYQQIVKDNPDSPWLDENNIDNSSPDKAKKGIQDYLGYVQVGAGLVSMFTNKKEPIDQIDPQILADARAARTRATYGLEGNVKDLALNELESTRRMTNANVVNYAGGSGSTALANIQKSNSAYLTGVNELAALDQKTQQEKIKYADLWDQEIASQKRTLFTDKYKSWLANETAAADLLQTGIENVIGAKKLRDQPASEKERDKMYNPTINLTLPA